MATNDIKIRDARLQTLGSQVFQVQANGTTINPGEPVALNTIGTSVYAIPMATGKPVIGTDYFAGIAVSKSNQTASADGTVEVFIPQSGVVYRATANSSTAANTAAKILALANKRVTITLSGGSYTVNTGASDGSTNGVMLTGTGSADTNEVDFIVSARATVLAF